MLAVLAVLAAADAVGSVAAPRVARAADWRAPVNLAGGLAFVNVLIAVRWR
ncbi:MULTISPECIES: hypothetical protein [Pseudofrankia]|uniref:hypothetical protein n=1 Tax=Pseudofrankia TaxID=2994363 RepID=UPI000234BD8D|nr:MULTISPECIES: hypothetical protein [Pseudofrankia]